MFHGFCVYVISDISVCFLEQKRVVCITAGLLEWHIPTEDLILCPSISLSVCDETDRPGAFVVSPPPFPRPLQHY